MKSFIIIFLTMILSACSVEEHNRKYLAKKALEIEEFQHKVLSDPESKIKQFDTYLQVNIEAGDGGIELYFVKKDHYAFPTTVFRHYPKQKESSHWSWDTSVSRKQFNRWFEEFWYAKFPEDDISHCSNQITKTNDCPSLRHQKFPRFQKQHVISWKMKRYKQCRCKSEEA